MLAFNPVRSAEDNLAAMREAVEAVVTLEVTHAVRDATVDGVAVKEGQFMALSDGGLAALGGSAEDALLDALKGVDLDEDSIVTVYWGEPLTGRDAEETGRRLEELVPGLQVDVIEGGQPHYPYLVSVE